jgi:outer membrane protein assembly factor BamE (lipoprotein component of BamABCDE complex)
MQANAKSRPGRKARRLGGGASVLVLTAALALAPLSGCSMFEDNVVHRGYVFDEQNLSQVRVGSAAEQVLIVLGTPSTTSTVGGDAWYYISQRVERPAAFLPQHIADQHVYAVYFDKNKKVTRIANYGLEDGKVVDFSSRTTVTGGGENRLLQQLMKQVGNFQFKF